jgi:hypothetical protein
MVQSDLLPLPRICSWQTVKEPIVKHTKTYDLFTDQLSARSPEARLAVIAISSFIMLLITNSAVIAQTNVGPGFLPSPIQTASTIPANGDVNPYGVAFVPLGFPGGILNPGDVLVSNFNNSQNLQGTGTTIVRITPQAQVSLFFTAR